MPQIHNFKKRCIFLLLRCVRLYKLVVMNWIWLGLKEWCCLFVGLLMDSCIAFYNSLLPSRFRKKDVTGEIVLITGAGKFLYFSVKITVDFILMMLKKLWI